MILLDVQAHEMGFYLTIEELWVMKMFDDFAWSQTLDEFDRWNCYMRLFVDIIERYILIIAFGDDDDEYDNIDVEDDYDYCW